MSEGTQQLLLYLGGILVVGAVPAIFMLVRAWQQGNTWEKVANQTGLTFVSANGDSRITGTYRGRALTADVVLRGSGKYTSPNTLIEVAISPVNTAEIEISRMPVAISREHRDRYRQHPEFQGVVDIGDAEFDKHYLVKTDHPASAQSLLAAGTMFRSSVESLIKATGGFQVTLGDGVLMYELSGRQTNQAKLQKILDGVCDAAEVLESSLR